MQNNIEEDIKIVEKQYCFNEDGNTGMCLGYGIDEPCEYCKSCEKLNVKED